MALDNDIMEHTCNFEQLFLGDLPNAHQAHTAEKNENLIRLE